MEEKSGKISVVITPVKSREKKSFWHINREMLPYKLHFLLFIGGAGAIFPFQSAFGITELGFTASNIAACFTAVQVCIIVIKPGVGYLTDYLNTLKTVIMGLAVIVALFSLFLIMIPNTGMPGIQNMQLTDTSQNKTYCEFCFNPEIFNSLSPSRYLNEEYFKQLSSCSNNNVMEHISVNCSTQYSKSTNSINGSYEIRHTTCDSSLSNIALSKNNSSEIKSLYGNTDSLHVFYINNSQNYFVCLFQNEKDFYHVNNSSDDLNQHCYTLTDEASGKLRELLDELVFTTLYCENMLNETYLQAKEEDSLSIANFKTYQFWAFAICLVLCCACGSSEFTISDTACYESIQGNDYGQQRVWGAISWGIMAPFAGYLNDYTESYMASWCVFACFTVLQIWNLSRMNLVKPDFSKNILKDMKIILSSMEFLCFESGVLMNGVFTGIIWYYLTWFIVSIGGNKLVIGLVHLFQCYFGEVPAMYFSSWLINKFGHFNLVSLALLTHGIRFFLYSYIHNPWWILPVESLHGLTFGSFYAAMTSYAKLNAKPGTEATTQSILCTTYEALGCGLGCIITGVCLEYFGGHTTFFYASFLCVVATLINVFFTFLLKFRKGAHVVTDSAANMERY